MVVKQELIMNKDAVANKHSNKLIWLVILLLSVGPYLSLADSVRALLS
jgi:uncharacterized Rmd1/YagE family protein